MKKVFLLLLAFLLLIIVRNNISGIFKGLQNENTAGNLKKELASEERKNQFLKERLFYVKTDQFIEEEARQKLGMVKNGEYIVIAPTSAPLNRERITIDDKPNWKKWLELFF